jgi:hypothetical protein
VGFEAARLSYNASLRAWVAGLNDARVEVIDFGGSPTLGYSGAELTSHYEGGNGRCHPNFIHLREWSRPFVASLSFGGK